MSKYLQVYDCELSHSNREKGDILSLACVIAKTDTLEIVDRFVDYACPRDFSCWNPYAEKTHGITKEKAATFQPQRDLAIKLLHFLKPYKDENDKPLPFVFYANNFVDYDFTEKLYDKVDLSSSFKKVASRKMLVRANFVYEKYLQEIGKEKRTKLSDMANEFGLTLNHHEVASDTEVCFQGLKKLVKFFKDKPPLSHHKIDFTPFNYIVSCFKG